MFTLHGLELGSLLVSLSESGNIIKFSKDYKWRIPRFPWVWGTNSQSGRVNLLFCNIFAKNCMEMKEFWIPGAAHPWRSPPWIRQWLWSAFRNLCKRITTECVNLGAHNGLPTMDSLAEIHNTRYLTAFYVTSLVLFPWLVDNHSHPTSLTSYWFHLASRNTSHQSTGIRWHSDT